MIVNLFEYILANRRRINLLGKIIIVSFRYEKVKNRIARQHYLGYAYAWPITKRYYFAFYGNPIPFGFLITINLNKDNH